MTIKQAVSVLAFAFAFTLVLAATRRGAADQIEVRDGKTLVGKIQQESPTEVTIQTTAGPQTVAVNRIGEIRYDGQGATMTQAKILFDSYSLRRAAEEFAKAQNELKDKPLVQAAAQFGQARALALLALDESSGTDDAIARMERFTHEHSQSRFHFALHELLGRLYADKKEFAKAGAAFDELAQAPWPGVKLRANLYHGRLLRAQNKPGEAAKRLDAVLAAKPDSPETELILAEALFEKAGCFRAQNDRNAEIATMERVIAQVPAYESSIQAAAYTELGDAYRAAARPKDALVAFLHVELLFSKNKELQARALYNLSQLWSELGHADRAAAARDTLKNEFPESLWNKKLGS